MNNDMEKQFIPSGIARQLRELGFTENCLGVYDDESGFYFFSEQALKMVEIDTRLMLAPLWQQAFDWFRVKHNLIGVVDFDETTKKYYYFINTMDAGEINWSKDFLSYEEAQLKCMEKLIQYSKSTHEEK